MYPRFLFIPVIPVLFFLTLAVLLCPGRASAQNLALAGFSETEKIGFAFYHLSKHQPPFDDWIRAREDYKASSMKRRLIMTDEQRIRLNEGFLSYFPDRDLITLRLKATISGGPNPDFQKDPRLQEAGLSHFIRLRFVDLQDVPYIPVEIGKLWVGIIPNGLDKLSTHYLTEQEYARLTQTTGNIASDRITRIQMLLRPQSADAKTPMMYKDLPVWLMMADIGALVLLGQNGALGWEYAAEWYDYARASSLRTLYAK